MVKRTAEEMGELFCAYVAKDEDRRVFLFENKPKIKGLGDGYWGSEVGNIIDITELVEPPEGDWKTLVYCPRKKKGKRRK